MKERELQVIRYLRNNARETLTRLSRKTGVPISTLFDRLKDLRSGLITRHTCLIDYSKLGYDLRVHILVKVPKGRSDFEEYITQHFLVNSVFRINNGYDYLLEAVFRNMRECTEFLQGLERFALKERKEYYVLEDLRREAGEADGCGQ